MYQIKYAIGKKTQLDDLYFGTYNNQNSSVDCIIHKIPANSYNIENCKIIWSSMMSSNNTFSGYQHLESIVKPRKLQMEGHPNILNFIKEEDSYVFIYSNMQSFPFKKDFQTFESLFKLYDSRIKFVQQDMNINQIYCDSIDDSKLSVIDYGLQAKQSSSWSFGILALDYMMDKSQRLQAKAIIKANDQKELDSYLKSQLVRNNIQAEIINLIVGMLQIDYNQRKTWDEIRADIHGLKVTPNRRQRFMLNNANHLQKIKHQHEISNKKNMSFVQNEVILRKTESEQKHKPHIQLHRQLVQQAMGKIKGQTQSRERDLVNKTDTSISSYGYAKQRVTQNLLKKAISEQKTAPSFSISNPKSFDSAERENSPKQKGKNVAILKQMINYNPQKQTPKRSPSVNSLEAHQRSNSQKNTFRDYTDQSFTLDIQAHHINQVTQIQDMKKNEKKIDTSHQTQEKSVKTFLEPQIKTEIDTTRVDSSRKKQDSARRKTEQSIDQKQRPPEIDRYQPFTYNILNQRLGHTQVVKQDHILKKPKDMDQLLYDADEVEEIPEVQPVTTIKNENHKSKDLKTPADKGTSKNQITFTNTPQISPNKEKNALQIKDRYSNYIDQINIVGITVAQLIQLLEAVNNVWIIPMFLIFKQMKQMRENVIRELSEAKNVWEIPNFRDFLQSEEYDIYLQKIRNEQELIDSELESLYQKANQKFLSLDEAAQSRLSKRMHLNYDTQIKDLVFVYLYQQVLARVRQVIKNILNGKPFSNPKKNNPIYHQEWFVAEANILVCLVLIELPTHDDKSFDMVLYKNSIPNPKLLSQYVEKLKILVEKIKERLKSLFEI